MRLLSGIFTFLFLIASIVSGGWALACGDGQWRCSDDALVLETCEGGEWIKTGCMRDQGRLCEDGRCVDPWSYGAPQWPRVEDEPAATKESLSEKAAYYEDIVRRLHLHPELKWVMGVELACAPVECAPGQESPCEDCTRSAVSGDDATWKDVVRWHTGENDGLWSSLYLTAEAFRYGATGSEEALENIRVLLEGERVRMDITGVPGVFTRQYIPPGVPGISCPVDKSQYVPDDEKDDNKWVLVNTAGCVEYVDGETMEWTESDHCGLEKFAGWCWLDNVSKDEYSGHMLALGTVFKLVDAPDVQESAKDMLMQVGRHLVINKMAFTDWDGRITEHGRLNAITLGDYPGFNAAMGLDYIRIAATATGIEKLDKWYHDCLLQEGGRWNCLKKPMEIPKPYTEYLSSVGLFPGPEGCNANYNNTSMHMLTLHNLIWFEHDPAIRAAYQTHFDEDVFRAEGQPRAVMNQNNALFDFIWASQKKLGPGSDGPAFDAVKNAVRMLRQFPARKYQRDVQCPPDKCNEYCLNRFKRPTGDYAREVAERCTKHFIWWGDPYDLRGCTANSRVIRDPADYLLAYWMGRYYGFIAPDM